jgi:biopolymer transport protein ExbD
MDPFHLRALIAPAMASLFLMLSLCAFVVQSPESVGMYVPVLRVLAIPGYDCPVLDRSIFVQLRKDGSNWINMTQVPANELRARLTEIYENRAEKFIYMVSDPDVSYGEFANFYSRVASSDSDLRIVLLTRQIQAQAEQCSFGSCCAIEWPDHDHSNINNVMIPIPPVIKSR